MAASSSEGISLGKLIALMPELVCVLDADGVFRLVSPVARILLGREPEELVGVGLASLVVDEDVDDATDLIANLGGERCVATAVLHMPVKELGIRRIRWSVAIDPADPGPRYAVAWDVTAKELAQERYRAVMEASPTALLMVSEAGEVVLANEAAETLLALDKWSLLGRKLETFVPGGEQGRHPDLRKTFFLAPAARPMGEGRDLSVVRGDGELRSVEIGLNPVELGGASYVVVSLVDVTERKKAREREQELAEELRRTNEALEELAVTDALTGLWNRRKFFEEADRFIRLLQQTGGPFSLVILDLDDFKKINDRFGHLAGDDVLRLVADELKALRRGSDIVARLGGEEFVVGLPGTRQDGAAQLAERLRVSVEGLRWQGRPVTASLGVATLRELGERGVSPKELLSSLLRAADDALYAAKAGGKNRVSRRFAVAEVVEG